jgi:hypothetical protein
MWRHRMWALVLLLGSGMAVCVGTGCRRSPPPSSYQIYAVDDDAFPYQGRQDGPGGAGGVFRIDPATREVRTVAGGLPFTNPEQLTYAGHGRLVLSDHGARRGPRGLIAALFEVSAVTGRVRTLTRGHYLHEPRGIVARPDGRVFVADRCGYRLRPTIVEVDRSGGQRIVSMAGLLRRPLAIALGRNGELLVADVAARGGAVIGINSHTGRQRWIAHGGLLDEPESIAVASNGSIYVGDRAGSRTVIVIDPDTGAQRRLFPELDDPPVGLGVAPSGELIVAGGGNTVQVLDPSRHRQETSLSNPSFVDVGQAVAVPSRAVPPLSRQPEPRIIPRRLPDKGSASSTGYTRPGRCKGPSPRGR